MTKPVPRSDTKHTQVSRSGLRRFAHGLYVVSSWLLVAPIFVLMAIMARIFRALKRRPDKPRLLWSGAPMPSLATTSQAMRQAGYITASLANQIYSTNVAGQFDHVLPLSKRLPLGLNTPAYLLRAAERFIWAMFQVDIYHSFFTGGVLGHTPLQRIELPILRLAGVQSVVMPYGSDAFVYADLPDTAWARAIKEFYPRPEKQDRQVKTRIARVSAAADYVVGCIVHTANLPKVDKWTVLWYPSGDDIEMGPVGQQETGSSLRIAHPSNHRQIKGTNSLIAAVERLRERGCDIDLDVIEGVTITESRRRMAQADIIIDQLLMGYAMTAVEGLAMGKVVVSGFNRVEPLYQPFYEKSYLDQCPIITASPDTIEDVLFDLYRDRNSIATIGKKSRVYYNMFHANKPCVELFKGIYGELGWNCFSVEALKETD